VQQLRVRPGGLLVARDDQAAGVRHAVLAQPGEAGVGSPHHLRHPVAAVVQGGAPGLGHQVLGHRLAQPGGQLVAGVGAPTGLARVGHEEHRPYDAVA